ncbi:hypothetical protein AK812_SmicGene19523 [Symbiodinium microadriaticum]|uniref:subtilisin n=1 Tax=Symbiodinium microadriaticum TaxID=2951 RepID=A0A1Q9DSD7_SYMMI|nr:hypothetical protein AK812_SmicGene19523 [Symbiodinium microadriaticum]
MKNIHPRRRVPYSRYGTPEGRAKPEFVVPGDGISSTAVGVSCGFKQMSGTSQSCGVAAGAAALVREYLLEWADTSQGRLSTVWSSTLRAALVTASEVDREGLASAASSVPVMVFGISLEGPRNAQKFEVVDAVINRGCNGLFPQRIKGVEQISEPRDNAIKALKCSTFYWMTYFMVGPGLIAVQSLADVSSQHFCLQLTPNVGAGALGITLAATSASFLGSVLRVFDLAGL